VEPHRLDAEIRPSNRSDFTGQAVTIAHLDAASLPEDSFLTRLCPQNRAVVMACSVEADWSDVIRSVNVLRPLCTGGRDVSGTVWPPPTLDLGVHIVTSDQPVFSLDNRALFVVAGLPGAGKSTLLRNIVVDPKVTLLDTDQMRSKLGTFFPAGTPYSYYRPLVHVLHTLRLVATAMRAPGPVVVHDPATGALTRTAFVVLGVLTGRSRHLLWIDCTAHEALAGQHHRGRVLPRWSFARHVRNAARFRRRLLAAAVPAGWHSVTMTDRHTVRHGMRIVRARDRR
jgi:hypothetical protein